MKYFYQILIACCGLMQSCNSDNELQFPYEDTLKQELMPLQGTTDPIIVEIKHPFLILQNSSKLNDSIYHIYDLTNHELKCAFGKRGEGPGEFNVPCLIRTQLSDFIIEDNHIFHKLGINSEGQFIRKESQEPKYINMVHEAAFINDSLFVVDAQYTGPDLYLSSMQDELPKKSWKYRNPNIMDYCVDPNMGKVYANESRIVFCYEYKKQIDFMDTEFNLIKSVKFKFDRAPNSELGTGNEKESYTYGYLGKHYLYVLFLGTSWNEYRANPPDENILEVFDLNGNPIAKYHLEGRCPGYFAVDEKTFTLYGPGEDGSLEDNLLVYKLKKLSESRISVITRNRKITRTYLSLLPACQIVRRERFFQERKITASCKYRIEKRAQSKKQSHSRNARRSNENT